MTRIIPKLRSRPVGLAVIAAGLIASTLFAAPAQARVFIGFGLPLFVGPPVYAPPPVYYPPPMYYPPPVYAPPQAYVPPTTYAPPQSYSPVPGAAAGSQSCYAGGYVCPMERAVSPGSTCYCTVSGNRVYGRAN